MADVRESPDREGVGEPSDSAGNNNGRRPDEASLDRTDPVKAEYVASAPVYPLSLDAAEKVPRRPNMVPVVNVGDVIVSPYPVVEPANCVREIPVIDVAGGANDDSD